MNREQAITILLALGQGVEDRRAAVRIVLDLLREAEQRPFTPKPWTPEEAARMGPGKSAELRAADAIIATERGARLRAEHDRDELLAAARRLVKADERTREYAIAATELGDVVAEIDNKTTREDT